MGKRFVEEGEILFRPLTYFTKITDHRSDNQEGKVNSDASGLVVEVWDDDSQSFKHRIDLKSGVFTRSLWRPDCCFKSCYSIRPQPAFGPSTIEIFNLEDFIGRVENPIKEALNVNLEYGRVEYYDQNRNPNQSADARQLWKFKRKSYAREKEFRLVFFLDADELMSRSIFESSNFKEPPSRTKAGSLRFRFGSFKEIAKVL